MVLERKWELLVGPVFFDNFENEKPGRFYMLRKCHRSEIIFFKKVMLSL